MDSLRVDIWSDVICPFCYMGKRKWEMALAAFPARDQVEIVWHSFELDPEPLQIRENVYDYLARRKGQSRAWSEEVHAHVVLQARSVGLEYNFDRAIVANTFLAHQFLHAAGAAGLAQEAQERIFRAYFTEGLDIADQKTLVDLGRELGLEEAALREDLSSGRFAADVRADEELARQIGIRGVPFFLLAGKLAVSGAQDPAVFRQALDQAWAERNPELP